MGGLLAWNVAERLEREGIIIEKVITAASAPRGDGILVFQRIKNDEDIKDFLRSIRQISGNVLSSIFFNEDLLPVIKMDFCIVKELLLSFRQDITPISAPITCLCGNKDPLINLSDMAVWNLYSNQEVKYKEYEGDHFFINDRDVAKTIISQILNGRI